MSGTVVRANLLGDDTALAGNVISRGKSPIFHLCRKLIAAGVDPDSPLECFRNGNLAIRVRTIRAGALLTTREDGTRGPEVVRWKGFFRDDVKRHIRSNDPSAPPVPRPRLTPRAGS